MSSAIGHRRAPRPASLAVERLARTLAPATPLARIQGCWAAAVGESVAAAARPTAERAGVLTVSCDAAVWAAELQMMGPELVTRLNVQLGESLVTAVRCRTT